MNEFFYTQTKNTTPRTENPATTRDANKAPHKTKSNTDAKSTNS